MEILIAGAGRVGYNIAKILSKKHNITIIDKNEENLNYISESLDILTVQGDLKDTLTYQNLDKKYDYYIAVTNSDETNILSALIIDDFSKIENKIIRINNTSYSLTSLPEKLNINHMIYSNTITVLNIEKLIHLPQANNIKDLSFTNMVLVSVNSEIEINSDEINTDKTSVIATVKEDKISFCNNSCTIEPNDLVYILGDKEKLKKSLKILAPSQPESIKNVLIFGATSLGIEIARVLVGLDLNIKLIEQDINLAHRAAHILQEDVMVINASYDDDNLFKSENLNASDLSIASTKNDEINIIKSLIAKKYGIKKPICINNNPYYHSIMNSLHLPVIRGPKMNTVYKILEEIDSKNIIFERFFMGFEGKIFIKKIFINKKINKPKENSKVIIIRDNNIINLFVNEETFEIIEGDIIIYFNTSGNKSWIENL